MGENGGVLGGGGMRPADMAAVMNGGYNDGWGGGCWWIVLVFFAMMMWGGNWGNNGFQNAIGYENLATSNEVQRGFDNQNSMANEREILAAVNGNSMQGMQNSNQNTQYITGMVNDKYNELQRDIAGIAMTQQAAMGQASQCCCETKMLISETAANQRYESAMQNNALMQAIREEGAATRSQADQRYMAEQDRRIAKLEMQNAMAGVVRYPMSTAYNAGYNPFCNCGNNYGCCGMAA